MIIASQDYWNQYLIQQKAIRQDIRDCLFLLFSMEYGNYERQMKSNKIPFDDQWIEDFVWVKDFYTEPFNMVAEPETVVIGMIKCEDDYGKIVIKDIYGNENHLPIDHDDFTIIDYIGILERLQIILDELGVDYKSYQ